MKQMLERLQNRLLHLLGRGEVSGIDDDKRMQELQVRLGKGELRGGIERFQNYGFTSVPLAGAEAAVVFMRGDRSHGLAIAVDDRRYRLTGLAGGEVALYDDQGQIVVLSRSGIEVTSQHKVTATAPEVDVVASGKVTATAPEVEVVATSKVTLDAPLVEATGEIRAVGDITAFDGLPAELGMAEIQTAFNTHVHPENDVPNNTDPPTTQIGGGP